MQFIMTDSSAEFHGIKMLVYGRSGAGKTQLSTTLKNTETLYIAAEPGTLTLRQFPPMPGIRITTATEIKETLDWLRGAHEAKQFQNIYFDSISEVAETVLSNAKGLNTDGRKAYGQLIDEMIPHIKGFRDLEGKNVIFTAKQDSVQDEVSKITSYGPSMPGKQLDRELPYMFDEVLRLGIGQTQEGTTYRFLQCKPDLQYTAKDRSGVLDNAEPPDLGLLFQKILARKQ